MKAHSWYRSEVPSLAPVYDKDDFINRNDSKDQMIPFLHFVGGLILSHGLLLACQHLLYFSPK